MDVITLQKGDPQIMKNVSIFALLMFITTSSHAFSLENSAIKLLCPQRGEIEVILHRYEHTQEKWGKDHFESGGGHYRKGTLLMIPFANQDQMLFNQSGGKFYFWYADKKALVKCQLLSLTNTYPVDVPYFRDSRS